MSDSNFPPLAVAARRAEREELYHRRHADALLDALLALPEDSSLDLTSEQAEARKRLLDALDRLVPLVSTLLEPPENEEEVVADGVAAASITSLHTPVIDAINQRFGTSLDTSIASPGTDHRLVRSDAFEPLMSRMCEVLDLDPTATW